MSLHHYSYPKGVKSDNSVVNVLDGRVGCGSCTICQSGFMLYFRCWFVYFVVESLVEQAKEFVIHRKAAGIVSLHITVSYISDIWY